MLTTIRPGDTLADRYRLDDLLSESGTGRFWRAHDRVLQRHVALHVIATDDERAPGLLEAARRSATVVDPRILRVLDAQMRSDVSFVVNEWGYGTSLDIALASNGPLVPRRAAWVVGEVAESLAVAHAHGVHHGRLVPENVLVDPAGSIRIIGLAVDAAMHGLPPGDPAGDVRDLAGLLYAGLTGRWGGPSSSSVPTAPYDGGRVLRPRQVRAGVPRPLDDLVDEVLNPDTARSRHTRDLAGAPDAAEVGAFLSDFVGDPTGIAESLAVANPTRAPEPVVLEQVPDIALRPAPPRLEVDPDVVLTPEGLFRDELPDLPPDWSAWTDEPEELSEPDELSSTAERPAVLFADGLPEPTIQVPRLELDGRLAAARAAAVLVAEPVTQPAVEPAALAEPPREPEPEPEDEAEELDDLDAASADEPAPPPPVVEPSWFAPGAPAPRPRRVARAATKAARSTQDDPISSRIDYFTSLYAGRDPGHDLDGPAADPTWEDEDWSRDDEWPVAVEPADLDHPELLDPELDDPEMLDPEMLDPELDEPGSDPLGGVADPVPADLGELDDLVESDADWEQWAEDADDADDAGDAGDAGDARDSRDAGDADEEDDDDTEDEVLVGSGPTGPAAIDVIHEDEDEDEDDFDRGDTAERIPAVRAALLAPRPREVRPERSFHDALDQARATTDEPDHGLLAGVPRRVRIAGLVALAALLVVAVLVASLRGGSDDVPAAGPRPDRAAAGAAGAAGTAIAGTSARVFDPTTSGVAAPDVPAVVDGNPSTTWTSETFPEQLGSDGPVDGVGVVVDTGAEQPIGQVDLGFVGDPQYVTVYVTSEVPQAVAALQPAADFEAGAQESVSLRPGTTGRYVVVWLTSLPPVADGFQAGITDVSVLG